MNLPGFDVDEYSPGIRIIRQTIIADAVDRGTYDFVAAPIGPERSDRLVLVGTHGSGGTARSNSSVSIGGSLATRHGAGASATEKALFASRAMALGTTANIQVVWSGTFSRCAIRIYSIYGLLSSTQVDDDTIRNTASTTASRTLTVTAGGIAFAAVTNNNNNRQVFAGVNEEYDEGLESGNCGISGGLLLPTPGGSLIISTTSVSDDRDMAVVSFR